ncbi:MAG: 4Fe-4S dicluster domain-containing protein [Smithellaceae bacterium]
MLKINETICTNCQACYDVCPYYVIGKEKNTDGVLSGTPINADPAGTALPSARPTLLFTRACP